MTVSTQPRPLVREWDWQRHAACRNEPTGVFFAPDGEHRLHRERRQAAAKAVCATCPVQASCLSHALAVGEDYGIWGGLTETERHHHRPR